MNTERHKRGDRARGLAVFLPLPGRGGETGGAPPPRREPKAARGGGGGGGSPARELRLFQHLYEVSKLLLCFDSAEQTVPAVLSLMTGAVALRSSILLYNEGGLLLRHTWRAGDESTVGLRIAEMHARGCYVYLAGAGALPNANIVSPLTAMALLPAPPAGAPAARGGRAGAESWVTLPLVVGRGRVFGALQFVLDGALDEPSLFFVAAVVNQLSIALDRRSTARAEHEWAAAQGHRAQQRSDAFERSMVRAQRARGVAEARCDRYQGRLGFSRAVTDSLGEGVVAVDLAGCITFFNPAAERLLGWGAGEAIGVPVQELLRLQLPAGPLLQPEECPLLHVLHTSETNRGDEVMFLGRDGAPFPVSYTSTPIVLAGQAAGAVLVFQNVMELKRSENAQHFLAEASAALGASLDYESTVATVAHLAVPSFADLCCLDLDAEADTAARAEVSFAGDDPDVVGALRRLLLEPPFHEAQAAAMSTGRGVLVAELAGPSSASLMVVPLRARGRPLGLLSFGSLGSGRRYAAADLVFAEELAHRASTAIDNARLHRQAQRAVRQRQDVLAVVSHDLRTPLGTIVMGTSLLTDHGDAGVPDGSDRRALELVNRAAAQMDRLINDLLDMSSIDAGHLSLEKEPHALGGLIADVFDTLRPLAARRSLRFEALAVGDGLALVTCDRWRIVQVLSNLVGNAIKFTPEGGSISLRAEARGRDVRFTVADDGPGIDGERLGHVFERYWQAKETARRGTGLGLYICKGIVEAHGGTMGVESEAGRGSTFFFTLPSHPAGAEAPGGPAEAPGFDGGAAPAAGLEVGEPPRSTSRPAPPPSLAWPSPPLSRR